MSFDLSRPEAITSIAANRKVWFVEPGSVQVYGQVIRFKLAGCGQIMQVHLDAIETVLSEPPGGSKMPPLKAPATPDAA
jgi:hypothetical protein